MLELARGFLLRKGLGEARLEAELLVSHALGLDRLGLFMKLDQPIQPVEVDRARDFLVRRGRMEPTAYIVGRREFYARDFLVGEGALVPRPETELIVDRAREIAKARGWERPRILDVGTGSGCIAVTLALEIEGAEVTALDLSEEALTWAKKNAEALGADVTLYLGDGLTLARSRAAKQGPFHLVVSNPPYVEPGERDDLAAEVREHEPPLALYAPPEDPDFWVRSLAEFAQELLMEPDGACLVELGHLQAPRMDALFRSLPGEALAHRVHDDLSGVPRMVEFQRASCPFPDSTHGEPPESAGDGDPDHNGDPDHDGDPGQGDAPGGPQEG